MDNLLSRGAVYCIESIIEYISDAFRLFWILYVKAVLYSQVGTDFFTAAMERSYITMCIVNKIRKFSKQLLMSTAFVGVFILMLTIAVGVQNPLPRRSISKGKKQGQVCEMFVKCM